MRQDELIDYLVENGDFPTKAAAKKSINAILGEVVKRVKAGDFVSFPGFGKFYQFHTSPREGKIPSGGEYKSKGKLVCKFRCAADFFKD